jgi:glycosyltransferase involved in cell wall biosynthesis
MSERLRVVRLLPVLDFGGVESRAVLQARAHDRQRYALTVLAFGRDGAAAAAIREAGVPVRILGTSPAVRNPRATLALLRALRELQPDILHASIAEGNFHGIIAGRLARVPVVIAEEVGAPEHRLMAQIIYGQLYRRASAVVGVTQAACDYVQDVDGCPQDKLRLIYNCADPSHFPAERRLPIGRRSSQDLSLLAVGRMVEVKNYATLLQAMAQAIAAGARVTLRLAGEGPLREQLQQQAQLLKIADRVQFLGFRKDIRTLLEDSDVFVLPSHSEGCSISLIEAMASGACVAASAVPGNKEVLGELAPESTAPPTDIEAWVRLLTNLAGCPAQQLLERGLRGQQRAYEHFSPQVYVANVQTLYEQLQGAHR